MRIKTGVKITYSEKRILKKVGPYDLVKATRGDRISIIDTRLQGEVVDQVEEGLNSAIVQAQVQSNFDQVIGIEE